MYDREALGKFVIDTAPAVDESQEYRIRVGDLLDIVFLYHSNLTTMNVPVRLDGRISLPYIGDAQAAGATPMALDSALTVRFAEILKNPSLSVIVKQIAQKHIYVLGEVKLPGGHKFDGDVSLIQALATAGGLGEGAKASHSVLIRQEGESTIVGIEIDVESILKGEALQNNIPLRDFDIVYVPRTRLKSAAEFVKTFQQIIALPVDSYFDFWQIRSIQANYEFFRAQARESN